jgi:23S rRNA pseudouridine1911/1915/1917 synthase
VRADGRRAVTRYEVVERWTQPQPTTLVRCALDTGRTHQIRVHLSAIGHPVAGDDAYGRRAALVGSTLSRPFLHAAALSFDHPADGRPVSFESPLAADLRAQLDALGP